MVSLQSGWLPGPSAIGRRHEFSGIGSRGFRNQHEIAHIDDRPDALSRNEHRIPTIDGIRERNHAADQAEIPKRDRDLTFGASLRGQPLNYPSAEEQPLSE